MPLQSSGAISLDAIHQEAGGSANSSCTINDSDIRDMIDKSDGATMAFNEWYGASSFTARMVMAGGGERKSMQYIDVGTLGNASDFGDMLGHNSNKARQLGANASSITRGVFLGGNNATAKNTLEYITFASTGDGTDFGDTGNSYSMVGISNDSRGVFMSNAFDATEIKYITIANTGDTTDFGNLLQGRYDPGSCASSTRGVCAGGANSSGFAPLNVIEYITTASTGNGSDFGDLSESRRNVNNGSMGSNTRGLFAQGHGGSENQNDSNGPKFVIDYITIASTGNATDFGDCSEKRFAAASGSSKVRALPRCGGYSYATPNRSTTMDYVTIASTGDASDFGDLVDGEMQWTGASNGCGGTSST